MYTVPFSYPVFSFEKAVSLACDTGVISGDAGPLLETVVEMLDELERPDAHFDCIQIAGTNGKGSTAAMHTHPIDLIAMTHNPAFLEKDVLTNLLWSMIPETRAFCPKGLGIVPYKMPSSVELAEATIAQLREYDVVMWEKHGVCAVGPDIFEAFDQVDVLSKSAQIYLTARSMGFEPAGTTQEQMDELKRAFNL